MNLMRLSASSATRSISRTTINLSFLDHFLDKCHNSDQFNQVLAQSIITGLFKDTYAASRILKLASQRSLLLSFIDSNYCKKIFISIKNSNGFIWNTMMKAYMIRNQPKNVILMYKDLIFKGLFCLIDNYTFPIVVQSCGVWCAEFEGREVHDHVVKMGFEFDVYVVNNLINMYGLCGNMRDARRVFDESPVLDVVSWNSILSGYVQAGDVDGAMRIYDQMPRRSVIASNSMVVLLGKSGKVDEARELFNRMEDRDLVSWTAMISSFEQNEMYVEALTLFRKMHGYQIRLDDVVLVTVLSVCTNTLVVRTGQLIHGLINLIGLVSYVNLQNALIHMYSTFGDVKAAEILFNSSSHLDLISWNSMISGYLRCSLVEKAREIFDSMPKKDIISWTAMISGYSQHGRFENTVGFFQKMLVEGVKPDEITLVSVISACTHLSSLDQGKWIHAYIRKNGIKMNVMLGTTLIDMYMKSGCLESAMEVFNQMEKRGVSSWNALILGLAMNGQVERALKLFHEMQTYGVTPNEVTFVAVLGACRHMGLVDEGRRYFDSMIRLHNIEPNIKHYGCMVDLLGRAGLLIEAEKLIDSMPMTPDVATWGALLGACRKYGDKEMGERMGRKLIKLQPDHDGFHVLLSNIYASKGSWENVLDIRGTMQQHGVVKIPGCSMIEANGIVHEFLAGDKSHPLMNEIELMLDEIASRLKMMGYAPNTDEVLLDIEEEEKGTTIFRHSDKLAIAFGLIAISPPAPIRIIKNLRICNDCHAAAKLISKAFSREIVVRDRHRFHHFKQGGCSCMEYW
ncbi:hypothetical protein Leryth_016458 [Lithospermum erythrorhizon]|nr:hypothetical protein Leryth_016458 [Lithospermum erythrorhizon]